MSEADASDVMNQLLRARGRSLVVETDPAEPEREDADSPYVGIDAGAHGPEPSAAPQSMDDAIRDAAWSARRGGRLSAW